MNPDQIAAEAAHDIGRHPLWNTEDRANRIKAAIISYVTQPKEIPLTNGKFAIVDHQDFISLAGMTWHCTSHGRAATGKTNYMHKVIAAQMGITGEVDHIDGNPLNNRRSNLRGCTRTQNQANAPKSRGSTSRYKGVHWSESHGGWVAQIKHNEKVTYLGKFDEETDAAITYDMAAKKEFGEYANLNFPIIQTFIEKAIKEHDKEQHYYAAHGTSAVADASERSLPEHPCPKCRTMMEPIGGEAYACKKCGYSSVGAAHANEPWTKLPEIVGSCNCLTKTNEVKYHLITCRYRQIMESSAAQASERCEVMSQKEKE